MFEGNKTLQSKTKKYFEWKEKEIISPRVRTYTLPIVLATALRLQAQLLTVKIGTFTNITSFSEGPQSTLGDDEDIMLASTVPLGNDRLRKGK